MVFQHVYVLCAMFVWGFRIVLDPFVHIYVYMLVGSSCYACCRFLGKVCMKQSRVLPFGQNQVRPPKEGSAAEPFVEAVRLPKVAPES